MCWRRLDEVPDDALPWAIVVARQRLSNARRGERRRTRLVGRIIALDPPAAADPASAVDTPSAVPQVAAGLANLGRADAEILRLWAWDELTSPQLAVVLGISANAAARHLRRSVPRLTLTQRAFRVKAFAELSSMRMCGCDHEAERQFSAASSARTSSASDGRSFTTVFHTMSTSTSK